jgi:hypothetical protein
LEANSFSKGGRFIHLPRPLKTRESGRISQATHNTEGDLAPYAQNDNKMSGSAVDDQEIQEQELQELYCGDFSSDDEADVAAFLLCDWADGFLGAGDWGGLGDMDGANDAACAPPAPPLSAACAPLSQLSAWGVPGVSAWGTAASAASFGEATGATANRFTPQPSLRIPTVKSSKRKTAASAQFADEYGADEYGAYGAYADGGEGARQYREVVAIPRYMAKRARRVWEHALMHPSRSAAAKRRPRTGGQFGRPDPDGPPPPPTPSLWRDCSSLYTPAMPSLARLGS